MRFDARRASAHPDLGQLIRARPPACSDTTRTAPADQPRSDPAPRAAAHRRRSVRNIPRPAIRRRLVRRSNACRCAIIDPGRHCSMLRACIHCAASSSSATKNRSHRWWRVAVASSSGSVNVARVYARLRISQPIRYDRSFTTRLRVLSMPAASDRTGRRRHHAAARRCDRQRGEPFVARRRRRGRRHSSRCGTGAACGMPHAGRMSNRRSSYHAGLSLARPLRHTYGRTGLARWRARRTRVARGVLPQFVVTRIALWTRLDCLSGNQHGRFWLSGGIGRPHAIDAVKAV